MTSTRFVMRLMIGSIGDRTVSRALRIESGVAESADVRGQVTLRRSWLKRACSSTAAFLRRFIRLPTQ